MDFNHLNHHDLVFSVICFNSFRLNSPHLVWDNVIVRLVWWALLESFKLSCTQKHVFCSLLFHLVQNDIQYVESLNSCFHKHWLKWGNFSVLTLNLSLAPVTSASFYDITTSFEANHASVRNLHSFHETLKNFYSVNFLQPYHAIIIQSRVVLLVLNLSWIEILNTASWCTAAASKNYFILINII